MTDITMNIDGGSPTQQEISPEGDILTICNLASNQLQDEFGISWPPSKLMPYLNLYAIEVINLKPDAYTVEEPLILMAGARQQFPSQVVDMIDALYNLQTTVIGTTISYTPIAPVVIETKKNNMDLLFPGWMMDTPNILVSYIMTDDRDPKKFYTYPPQPSGTTVLGAIMVLCSEVPPEITTNTLTLPFDQSYWTSAVDYLIYRCLAESTTIPNAQQKAATYYSKFLQDLGSKDQAEEKLKRGA